MDLLSHEFRHCARSLVRRPAFTAAAVATLALGIGANIAIFSVVYAVLLRPLPFADPGRLMALWETNPERGWTRAQVAAANFLDWREQAEGFSAMAAHNDWLVERTLPVDGQPQVVRGNEVTGSFFEVLGVAPLHGTTFREEHTWAGGEPTVVLSHGLWQRLYGGDPEILGGVLELDGTDHTVLGVMPPSFRYPFRDADVWLPVAWDPGLRQQVRFRRAHGMRAVARLAPGVSREEAAAELALIARRLEAQYPETNTAMGNGLMPLHEWIVGDTRLALKLLMTVVGFVLLIACANVANLLLARGTTRRQEMALRTALGASRRRLLAMGLVESLMLAVLGGVSGLALGAWGVRPLVALSPETLPRIDEVSLNAPVVLFTLCVSLVTGLVFGALPAWRAAGGTGQRHRVPAAGRRPSAPRRPLPSTAFLVTAQIALTLPLVVGAGLMVRTLGHLSRVEPGFEAEGTLVAKIALPATRYGNRPQVAAFFGRLLEEVRAAPGVGAAAVSSRLPFGNQRWSSDFTVDGWPADRYGVGVRHDEISEDLFRTMGVPLLRGRDFSTTAGASGGPTVIINRALADRFFPDEDPIGRRVTFSRQASDTSVWRTIVGVAGNVRRESLSLEEEPSFYAPIFQDPTRSAHLLVRSDLPPEALLGTLRERLRGVDPALPLFDVTSLEDQLARAVATERFLLALLGVFAAVALTLAVVGVLAVVSYGTLRRRREFGIRLALGATRKTILSLVLRRGLAPVFAGIALGLAASALLTRSLASFLFEVRPLDPFTFTAVVAVLVTAAVVACALPARWATRVDPAQTLRAP